MTTARNHPRLVSTIHLRQQWLAAASGLRFSPLCWWGPAGTKGGHGGSLRSLGGAILFLEGSFLGKLLWQLLLYLLSPLGLPKGLNTVLRPLSGLGLGEGQHSRCLCDHALDSSVLLLESNFLGGLQFR